MADFTQEELSKLIQITELVPKLKVNREEYLTKVFSKDFPNILNDIIEKSPIKAYVNMNYIITKAKDTISRETSNGFIVFDLVPKEIKIGTINLYLMRYVAHLLVVLQKLCYLFDMPYFSDNNDITDSEITIILIYLCSRFEDDRALEALSKIAKQFSITNKEKIDIKTIIDSDTVSSLFTLFGTKLNSTSLWLTATRTFLPNGIHLSYVRNASENILKKFIRALEL